VIAPTTELGAAGGRLRDGDSIYGGTRLSEGEIPTLAYHVGPGSCDVDYATSQWKGPPPLAAEPGEMQGGGAGLVLPVQHGCGEPTPGYVFLATAAESLIADDESAHLADPFVEGGDVMLTSLSAVPVTFVPPTPAGSFTEMPPTRHPTMAPTPTLNAAGEEWATYRDDRYGWSIDHPSIAVPMEVEEGVAFMIDGEPFVTIVRDAQAPHAADDSRFPLDADDVTGGFTFRGDGLAFRWIAGDNWEALDPAPGTMLYMLNSLVFEPWSEGQVRNGWAALPGFSTSAEWVVLGDGLYVVFREEVSDGSRVFGPIESCGEGQSTELAQGGTVAVQECPDGTSIEYTYEDGGGAPERPVIVAHDDSRLVQLP
jgi:hypothetical protein